MNQELLELTVSLKQALFRQQKEGILVLWGAPATLPAASLILEEELMALPLDQLREQALKCTKCPLHQTRTHVVFGAGNPKAELMFVGEAPGQDEDIQGLPFVGLAGQLLTKIIEAMGYQRREVYIANILKCHPPNNRSPQPSEIEQCTPYLQAQIKKINPKIIIALGSFAAQTLLRTDRKITSLRGIFHDVEGVRVMPTYHPAYLLRNPNDKKLVWEDMKQVMAALKKWPKG